MQQTTSANDQTIATVVTSTDKQNKKISTTYFFLGVEYKISIDDKYKPYLCSSEATHIIKNPMQCSEGHLSCLECTVLVSQLDNEQFKKACPVCYLSQPQGSNNIPEKCFKLRKDVCVERTINSIPINCPTKTTFNIEGDQECSWHGDLKSLKSHLITECTIFPKNEVMRSRLSHIEDQLKENAINIAQNTYLKNEVTSLKNEVATLKNEVTYQRQEITQRAKEIADTSTSIKETEKTFLNSINSISSNKLIWKIDDFTRKLREAKDSVSGSQSAIYSPSFYTENFGYHLTAKVYLNGDGYGKDTHLSLFIQVKKGEYDAILEWPFNKKISFTLINQEGRDNYIDTFNSDLESSSFKRPKFSSNIASGSPLFVEINDIKTKGFLKDDAIFIEIKIENR